MDALTYLESQHREVEALFDTYHTLTRDADKLESLKQLADNLEAHMTIEEKVFYPAVFVDELAEKLNEAMEEHLSAKRVVADLLKLREVDETFEAKMKVLEELVEHHVEEEEEDIFPTLREDFDQDELEDLGERMEAMFDELMEGKPRFDVLGETDEAAQLR